MINLYALWKELFAAGPLQVGEVIAYDAGIATVELPGGGILRAHGEATIGAKVYVRDRVIQGPAPDLPVDVGEV
ncbi:hypothetical protein [Ottowia sp. VDI28]|uniref:hypothetical protein n=1 Tax=Ottowia sp. VDI28 TaxID=3133968 RepID=UPI003C2B4D48